MPKQTFRTRRASQGRRTSRSSQVPRQRRPPASHLLVIECEPKKLAQHQLDFGSKITTLLRLAFLNKKIVLVKASSRDELCRALGETLQAHDRFRTVLIVGHSNAQGLQLTPDDFYEWSTIGGWLKPFQPEFLVLAACSAGRSEGIGHLFEQIKTLREIYASPISLFRDQTHPFALLLGAVLKHRKIDETFRGLQSAGYLFTDAIIYRFKRKDTRPGNELEQFAWDLFGLLINRRASVGSYLTNH